MLGSRPGPGYLRQGLVCAVATASPGSGFGLWWQCAEVTEPWSSAWGCPGLGWHVTSSSADLADPMGAGHPGPSRPPLMWRLPRCGGGQMCVAQAWAACLGCSPRGVMLAWGGAPWETTEPPIQKPARPPPAPLGWPRSLHIRKTAQRGEVSWPRATVSHLNLYANSVRLRSPACAAGLVEGFFTMNLFCSDFSHMLCK